MSYYPALLGSVVISGAIAIYLDIKEHPLFVFIKPLPLLLLLIPVSITAFRFSCHTGFLVSAALVLGMTGDILLTRTRLFPYGLVSFLLGHLFYIAYFRAINTETYMFFFIVAGVTTVYGYIFFSRIKKEAARGKIPVAVYMIVITLMVITAGNVSAAGVQGGALFLAGALLFYVSDAILAWHLMVTPVRWNTVLILAPYYAGQLLIATGMLIHCTSV